MLHIINSDTPFDVVFLYFWEPGDIQYLYGYRNILICLKYMTVFGIGSASGINEITPEQVTQRYFRNLFTLFGLPKMIVVDEDGLSSVMFKINYQ